MPTFTLNKSIEAMKLHPRTRTPLGQSETIPFGAIIDHVGRDRDTEQFQYLTGLYGCRRDLLESALDPGALRRKEELAAPAAEAPAEAKTAAPPGIVFTSLNAKPHTASRAKVPGGWLILINGSAATFYPDPEHAWDGTTLP
ncbi:MAG: hypothetical protein ACLQVN_06905 [Bryobacteraceae bacterium]